MSLIDCFGFIGSLFSVLSIALVVSSFRYPRRSSKSIILGGASAIALIASAAFSGNILSTLIGVVSCSLSIIEWFYIRLD
jgi:hypothetical protein